jgi:hypothetical protein
MSSNPPSRCRRPNISVHMLALTSDALPCKSSVVDANAPDSSHCKLIQYVQVWRFGVCVCVSQCLPPTLFVATHDRAHSNARSLHERPWPRDLVSWALECVGSFPTFNFRGCNRSRCVPRLPVKCLSYVVSQVHVVCDRSRCARGSSFCRCSSQCRIGRNRVPSTASPALPPWPPTLFLISAV